MGFRICALRTRCAPEAIKELSEREIYSWYQRRYMELQRIIRLSAYASLGEG